MKRIMLVIVGVMLSCNVMAAGNAAAGKEKSAMCAGCHGATGATDNPMYPILAGQYANYLERTLLDYKSGERKNAIMSGMVAALSKQDIKDLSAFYAKQAGGVYDTPLTGP